MTAFTALAAAAVRRLRSAPRKAVRLAVALMAAGLALGSAGAASAADPQPFLWNGSTAPGSLPDALVGQPGYSFSAYVYNNTVSSTSGTVTMVITTPASLSVTGVSVGSGWSCGAASQSITCTHAGAIGGFSNSADVQVTGNFATNSPSTVSPSVSISGGNDTNSGNNTTTVPISVTVARPSFSHAFSPTTVTVGDSSTVTYTLSNFANYIDLTGLAFSNSLPSGVTVASPNGLTSNCTGSASATAGGSSISLGGATLTAQSGTCQIAVNVTASTSGSKVNQPGNLTSNEAPARTPSSRTLTVNAPAGVSISGVSPSSGNGQGPASVTISGTGFSASGNTVSWGGVNVTPTSESTTSITLTPPNRSPSQVDVTVTNASAQSDTLTNGYTYYSPPLVSASFSDASIETNDSTELTISFASTGLNYGALTGLSLPSTSLGGLTATLLNNTCGGTATGGSSIAASFATLSAGGNCQITYTITAASAGTYNFTAPGLAWTGPFSGSGSAASPASLNVTAPVPTVSALSPVSGSASGGTSVVLTGTNFTGATAVTFGGVNATSVTIDSDTQITAVSPAGSGTVDVQVVTADGSSDTSGFVDNFTYYSTATISVSPASVSEDGATNLTYTITLSPAPVDDTTVFFTTSGTAVRGTDYASISLSRVIAAGSSTATVTVNPTADANVEADETATLTLTSGGAYIVGSPASATGNILNDDLPALSINDVTLSEGASGTTNFTFTASLSSPALAGGVSFTAATGNGSATAGSDYTSQSQVLSIAQGSSTATFTVPVTGDATFEADEIFFVNLTGVSGAALADGQGLGTITNDDAPPAPSFTAGPVSAINQSSATFAFTVTSPATAECRLDSAAFAACTSPVTLTGVPDGTHSFEVRSIYGGSPGASASRTWRVDTVAPSAPVITSPADGALTTDTTPDITGTAEALSTIIVSIDGGVAGTAFTDGVGGWTFTPSSTLSGAPHTVTATATDQAGNTSASSAPRAFAVGSTDASLSGLTLSQGVLSPAFASGTTSYTASVANAVTSLNVTPTTNDGMATLTVNGVARASGAATAVPLSVGVNTITVVITASDGVSTSTYTVTVTRAPSAVSTLSSLGLSAGTLSPSFSSGTTSYSASVANGVTSVTLTPTASEPNAVITVNGSGVTSGGPSGPLSLLVGANVLTVAVTAQDGVTTSTYTVTVTRAPSAVSTLSNLSLSSGTLSPTFASGTTSYATTVPNAVTAITVTPTVTDANATVTVNGAAVVSGAASASIPLSPGANTITLVATAQDGVSTGTYSVVVTREASSVATLSNLSLSSGTLSPAFSSGTAGYTASVGNAVTSVTVTPTVTDATATVTVNGVATTSGSPSAALPLAVGLNTVAVVSTAQDGVTTRTYTVTITRAGSPVSTLSGLAVSGGSLSPAFSSGATNYAVSVDGGLAAITVTPTVTQPDATVTVNGVPVTSGAASAPLALNPGANTITVRVTAQDGVSVTTYRITVSRAYSSISTLSGLTLSGATLTPAFGPATTAYSASVDAATASVTVTPTLTDIAGFITVNGAPAGSGFASDPIPLSVGLNTITVVATAPNGLTSTAYTISVTRGAGAPTAANISGLNVPHNSTGFDIDLSGSISGARTGVRVVTPPAHGTTTVSGQVVIYTPANGYTGADSFGWVADGPGGTSNTATVSLTVAAPAVPVIPTPPVTPTPPGDGQPVTVTLTDGGGSITDYDVTVQGLNGRATIETVSSAPSGEAAPGPEGARTFVLRYTPNAGFMGTDTVTLVAVGPGGRSAPAVFTFRVAGKAPDLSAAVALGGSVTLRPTTGLTGGPFQGIRITRAPAFGTAVVQGLTIVYSPGSGPGGSTSFDYVIDLPFGASAAGRVSVTAEATPVIPALTATTIAGRPVTVSLTANALNGPFTAAAVTSVSPAGSGVATLTEGGTPTARTYDLTFTPSGTFTGQAVINFTLSRGAATGSGVLTVTVQPRPDPALDPEVRGIVSSQADTARRFAEAQSGNFLRRLDAVRSGPNRSSFALGLNGGDQQDLLSDPGQALRRQLGFEADPVSRAATESWRMLAPETAAGAAAPRQPAAVPGEASPVGLWASGGVNWGRRDASGRRDDRFTTSGLTAGVDWRVSDTLIVGAGVGYGRDRTRVGSDESRSDGRSRTGALYAGFRPADGVTVGGVLGQGELEFDSRRWSADASAFALGERSGSVTFGAIEAALDRQAGRWGWSPYGRLDMARIRLDAFSETGAGSYALAYEAMDVETMSGALGLRLNGRFARHGQAFEPAIRLEWTHAFDDTETQYLRYADWVASPRYGLELDSWSRDQVTVDLEGRWSVGRQLELTAGYAASLGDSSVSQGLRLRLQAKF